MSGYVARSISRHCKCSLCKELLIAGDDSSSIYDYLPDEYKQLFKNVNSRGLLQLSKFIYTVMALAELWQYGHLSYWRTDGNQVLSM